VTVPVDICAFVINADFNAGFLETVGKCASSGTCVVQCEREVKGIAVTVPAPMMMTFMVDIVGF
jgi:hypothetical protein